MSLRTAASLDAPIVRKIGHGGYLSGRASDGNNVNGSNGTKFYQTGINSGVARSTAVNELFGVQAQCGPVAANRILLVEWWFEGLFWTTQNAEIYFDTMVGEGRFNYTTAVAQTRVSWTTGYSPSPKARVVFKTPTAFADLWVGLGLSAQAGSGAVRVANSVEQPYASGITVFDTGPA